MTTCGHTAQWVTTDGVYCANCKVYLVRFVEEDLIYSEEQVAKMEKSVGA